MTFVSDGYKDRDVTGKPMPTIRAGRRFTMSTGGSRSGGGGMTDKPPYRVPSMAEIAEVRGTNGLTVASTFSGCGGSCLGYAMAGFHVVWANEFVPAAAEVYRLNHDSILDTRDIRTITDSDGRQAGVFRDRVGGR